MRLSHLQFNYTIRQSHGNEDIMRAAALKHAPKTETELIFGNILVKYISPSKLVMLS